MKNLTPKKIVEELDKYIVSQDEAKKSVAISLRNRDRRKSIKDPQMRKEIKPKNIILVGSTGVGKTEIARRIALIADAPFIKVDATKYTEVGYVGQDVETMIKDLLAITIRKLKDKKIEELQEEVLEKVLETVARKLRPLDKIDDEKFKKLIKEIEDGKHDDETIEIDAPKKENQPLVEVVAGGEEGGNIDAILDHMTSFMSKTKKIKTNVRSAISILIEEEVEKHLDVESLVQQAIVEVEGNGIIFIDEIDKIIETSDTSRSEVSRSGVQRDILPIVEGTRVVTKYGTISTEHILFIAAGAFSNCSPQDLMPELQGRFPIVVNLKKLEKKDFVKILTKVKYNLLEQYMSLLKVDNVNLVFDKTGVNEIANLTYLMNERVENIGARRLSSILEEILQEIMYEAPYKTNKNVNVDKEFVKKTMNTEMNTEDIDKFIL